MPKHKNKKLTYRGRKIAKAGDRNLCFGLGSFCAQIVVKFIGYENLMICKGADKRQKGDDCRRRVFLGKSLHCLTPLMMGFLEIGSGKGFSAFIGILIFAHVSECVYVWIEKFSWHYQYKHTPTYPWKLKPTNVCSRKSSWLKKFCLARPRPKINPKFSPKLWQLLFVFVSWWFS